MSKTIKTKYNNEITEVMKKCDVVVIRELNPFFMILAAFIMNFTKTPYAHAEMYMGDGWNISSDGAGVNFNDWINKKGRAFDVFRMEDLTSDQIKIIEGGAYKQIGKPFDYTGMLTLPWANFMVKKAAKKIYFCSELVSFLYKQAGIDLLEGIDEAIQAPGILVKSPKLKYVATFKDGKMVHDTRPFEMAIWQRKPGKISKFIIEKIIDPSSSIDEVYEKIGK